MCDCDKYVKFNIARIAMLQLVFKAEVSEMSLSKSLSLLKKNKNMTVGTLLKFIKFGPKIALCQLLSPERYDGSEFRKKGHKVQKHDKLALKT